MTTRMRRGPELVRRSFSEGGRSAKLAREWRQFRLLRRDSLRRLLNAAVLSRDADPWQFAIFGTAFLAVPPSMFAFGQMFKYAALRRAVPIELEQIVLIDRMFFIVYAMVTAALLAALTWEALLPDRVDQEITGVLPVRARTVAGAQLAAALTLALLFAAAIHVPAAVTFALIAAANPLVGHVVPILVGHMLATILAALTTFTALLVLRGVAALALSASAANALAGVLQLASVAALIETFLYLPSVLPRLVRQMYVASVADLQAPPVWFAAMYEFVAGPWRPAFAAPAATAAIAFALTLVVVVPVYVVPASWIARRALSSPSKQGMRWPAALVRSLTLLVSTVAPTRGIIAFTLATFTRSRRHIFVVLTYIGIGVALAAVSVIAATVRRTLVLDAPAAYLLALPLVLMFFLAIGLRVAFGIPVEIDANWVFRSCNTGVRHAANGTRGALLVLAVYPVAIVASAVAWLLGWGVGVAATVGLFDVLSGVLLVEAVTYGWHTVPFARTYAPAVETLKSRALIILIPLNLFAYRGADAQMAALRTTRGTLLYITLMIAVCVAVGIASRRASSRVGLTYERESPNDLAVLGLSEAG